MARASTGKYNRFITITMNQPAGVEGWTRENLRKLSRSWAVLRRFLVRNYGLSSFTRVVENHKSGWPHLHAAVRSRYIPQKLLSGACERAGLGRVVDIRLIRNQGALHYLSKYLAKGLTAKWPRYARRVQSSIAPTISEPSDFQFLALSGIGKPIEGEYSANHWNRVLTSLVALREKLGHVLGPDTPFPTLDMRPAQAESG